MSGRLAGAKAEVAKERKPAAAAALPSGVCT